MDFIRYMRSPLSEATIDMLYNSNNIMYEKVMLFGDFMKSFIDLTIKTYMGDNITDSTQKINHFQWCWDTTKNNFKKENIIFYDTLELENYVLEIMVELFYLSPDKELYGENSIRLMALWDNVFSFDVIKTQSDMDTFLELYKLFDKALENKKTIDLIS